MIDPALPGPEGMRPELLAAYADGELDLVLQAEVERWLARHPHALKDLKTQRQLSPANWPFWRTVEPPLPSDEVWFDIGHQIAGAVHTRAVPDRQSIPRTHHHRKVRVRVIAGLVAAAILAITWGAIRPTSSPPHAPATPHQSEVAQHEPMSGPPLDVDPFPIASDADIEIHRVTALDSSAFPVGEVPFGGALVLATEDEVEVEGVDEHPHWPSGGPVVVPNRGDAPMIYVSRSR